MGKCPKHVVEGNGPTPFENMRKCFIFIQIQFCFSLFQPNRCGIPRDQSVLSNLAQMFPDEDDIDTPR